MISYLIFQLFLAYFKKNHMKSFYLIQSFERIVISFKAIFKIQSFKILNCCVPVMNLVLQEHPISDVNTSDNNLLWWLNRIQTRIP